MDIVNVSTAAPERNWLASRFADRPEQRWTHVSTDYLQEGVDARLAAPHDPLSLARAIESLAADDGERRRLGENGRTFARTHCMEDNAVAYFDRYLKSRRTAVPR